MDDTVDIISQLPKVKDIILANMEVFPFKRPLPRLAIAVARLDLIECDIVNVGSVPWRPLFDFINVFPVIDFILLDSTYMENIVIDPILEARLCSFPSFDKHLPITRTSSLHFNAGADTLLEMQALAEIIANYLDLRIMTSMSIDERTFPQGIQMLVDHGDKLRTLSMSMDGFGVGELRMACFTLSSWKLNSFSSQIPAVHLC